VQDLESERVTAPKTAARRALLAWSVAGASIILSILLARVTLAGIALLWPALASSPVQKRFIALALMLGWILGIYSVLRRGLAKRLGTADLVKYFGDAQQTWKDALGRKKGP
jgi:hypothetical protein